MSERYILHEKDYGEGSIVYFVTDTLSPYKDKGRFSESTKIFHSLSRAKYYKNMMEEHYGVNGKEKNE